MGRRFGLEAPFLEGAVLGQNAPCRSRRAPLLARGARYLLRMASWWVKRVALSYQKGAFAGGKAHI